MEVIRENFDAIFPEIRNSIKNCSFMAIDTELTGLRASSQRDNYFDTMEERYQVIRETSNKFLIIQFGLVTFFYDEETDSFTHKAYNFYTYPSQTKNFMPTVRFMCESSSIEFLSSFGFDFNKLFHHGIPYLSNTMVHKVIEENEEREAKYENEKPSTMSIPENFKKFVDDSKVVIKRFIASTKKEYIMETLSPFQRRLIFENFKPQFPNLLFETVHNDEEQESDSSLSEGEDDATRANSSTKNILSTPTSAASKKTTADESALPKSMADLSLPTQVKQKKFKKPLKITKVSEEELQSRKNQKKLKFENDINSMIGFSKVIQEIGLSNKIVVGHNMMLDISHAINQFIDDLPDNLADFKNVVQTTFPNLVDTKLMSCQLPFRELMKSSVLTDVMKRLETEPFTLEDSKIHPDEDSKGYDLEQNLLHEAGYDAYITGLCFISMCKYLGTQHTPKKSRVLPESPLVMPYINKIYLMRMMDVCYMNISGTDLTPSRSHVFFVQCPKGVKLDEIRSWFSPFGQIQYQWQGDDIFVSVLDKDQAPLVIRNLEQREGYSIVTFDKYNKMKQEKLKLSQNSSTTTPFTTIDGDPSPPSVQTKRPKTESTDVKRKPAVKAPVALFEQPAWD